MNVAKFENFASAFVAFSFVGLQFVAVASAKADASEAWTAYREAQGLPVTASPSERLTDPCSEPKVRLASLRAAVSAGDGNRNSYRHETRVCDPVLVQMARTDGDPMGETAPCE